MGEQGTVYIRVLWYPTQKITLRYISPAQSGREQEAISISLILVPFVPFPSAGPQPTPLLAPF